MSLASKNLDTLKRRETTARERYLAALRAGKPVEEIASAAREAGIDPSQIQADGDALDRAAELRTTVERLPTLRKATAEKQRIWDAAGKALDDAIAKLQPIADFAAVDLQSAQTAEREGRSALAALVGLYADRPDLLDAASAPAELRELWKAETAQARTDAIAPPHTPERSKARPGKGSGRGRKRKSEAKLEL